MQSKGSPHMTDQARARTPVPHMQTRPATVVTAVGLCAIIMLIQFVPEFQSIDVRLPTAMTVSAR